MATFRQMISNVFGSPQERALWDRSTGNMQLAGGEGVVYLGSDQWPGVLGASSTAEALPVVTRATSLITSPLTAAPFQVQHSRQGSLLPTPRWMTDPMLLRPDGRLLDGLQAYPAVHRLSRSEFWTGFLRSAIWWGRGVFIYQESESGYPLAGTLKLIHPHALGVEDGRWVIGTGPDAARFDRDGGITFGDLRYRLVVLRNPHSPVDEHGNSLGVFDLHADTFKLAQSVDGYSHGTFASGVPAGYLRVETPGLTQEQATALKTAWLAAHGGDKRSIAVLNSTTSFTPISMSPVDAALVDVKRLSVSDVAFAFGLDPVTLGVAMSGSNTYTNIRDAWSNHRDFGLSPWLVALQDCLTALLPGDQTAAANLDGFANPPAGERYAAYKTAIDSGVLTIDEVRALEGLPPLEAPDEPESTEVPSISEEGETNG